MKKRRQNQFELGLTQACCLISIVNQERVLNFEGVGKKELVIIIKPGSNLIHPSASGPQYHLIYAVMEQSAENKK